MKVCPLCGDPADGEFCGKDGTRLVDPEGMAGADPLAGKTLAGKYTILRLLGQGGMGQVYLANQEFVDRKVAVKVLRPEITSDPHIVARFLQEARAGSRINHPNVVVIHDFGYSEDRTAYLVMELVPGIGLDRVIADEGRLSWRKTVHLAKQIAEALGAAHALSVIHRDVKPGNVLVDRRGGGDFVKVLDFGLAKLREAGGQELTQRGQFLGTPEFMAPEQVLGLEVGPATDLYALGVLIFTMLVGDVPFKGSSATATIMKQLQSEIPRPSKAAPEAEIPAALDEIVLRCVQKDPKARYGSMAELTAALESLEGVAGGHAWPAGGPSQILLPSEPAITRHELSREVAAAVAADRRRRRRTTWLLAGVGATALATGAALWLASLQPAQPPPGAPPTRREAGTDLLGPTEPSAPPSLELPAPRGYRLDRLPFDD